VAGYLKSIHVDVGDRVAQGQLIGILEVPEFTEELAHAAASEKRSELDVVRAETEVTRAESAFNIRKLSHELSRGRSSLRSMRSIQPPRSFEKQRRSSQRLANPCVSRCK
jgi:multidrug efflux pump subunit AcrA (membrane-fusion protein)